LITSFDGGHHVKREGEPGTACENVLVLSGLRLVVFSLDHNVLKRKLVILVADYVRWLGTRLRLAVIFKVWRINHQRV
jgi:hypothetical protein